MAKHLAGNESSRLLELQLLFELAGTVNRSQDLREICNAAVRGLKRVLRTDRAGVLVARPDGLLHFEASIGLSARYRRAVEALPPWEGTRTIVSDVQADPATASYTALFAREGIRAVAFLPLLGKKGLIGKCALYYDAPREMDPEELELLEAIAAHLAVAVERQVTDAALRESELLNKQIIASIPECIFVLDVTDVGRFKFAALNPAEEKAIGFTSAQVSGKFIEDVLAEDAARKVVAHYRDCVRSGWPVSYDDELNLEIGSRYFHTTLIPVRNTEGKIYRLVGCCNDLTDSRRNHEQALSRQKLETIGLLASGIAHDFNNLLGGILASTELAMDTHATGCTVKDELQRIRTASIRGAEIVRELLTYSGKETPALEAVDISNLVQEMLNLMEVAVVKSATLKTDLTARLPKVLGNPVQIRQLVMNLVMNASDAIGDSPGIIHVTTQLAPVDPQAKVSGGKPTQPTVLIKVSDTGCGIDPASHAKVFDPFFTTKGIGRGLGLAVVHGIVRSHEGTIDFVSAPGRGTTFRVLLPAVAHALRKPSLPSNSVSAPGLVHAVRTILVVEDEELLRIAVAKMLRKRGFEVIEASDGSSAIDLLRVPKHFDAILLDVTIPGVSSREVYEASQQWSPTPRVIFTSAYSRETINGAFPGVKINHFVRKPFHLQDLLSALGVAQN